MFEKHPVSKNRINTALYNKAFYDQDLKVKFEKDLNSTLKTSLNPRRIKTVSGLPQKFMDKIMPYGTLVSKGGFEMDYQGVRFDVDFFVADTVIMFLGLNHY